MGVGIVIAKKKKQNKFDKKICLALGPSVSTCSLFSPSAAPSFLPLAAAKDQVAMIKN